MCPDKSNVYPLDCKLDNNYKTMVVASDIKHIMLVADIIHAVEISLYIGKVFPTCHLYNLHPFL